MVSEDNTNKIVEYLKKQGQSNTFRLATELGIDRSKILNIVKKLEEKQVVEVHAGIVKFLKFPRKEKKVVRKKPIKIKKVSFKHKKAAIGAIKAENIRLKEKLSELQKVPPKIVRRNIIKKVPIIKRIHVKSKKFKEQTEYIKKLEEKIKELKQKVKTPKIIRRTIVKKIPVKVPPGIITKTIIKKVPVKVKEKIEPKKFKIPKFLIKFKKPKPKKQKIKPKKPKINFSKLTKNIKQLHVPEILRNP